MVVVEGLEDLGYGGVEVGAVMVDGSRRQEDAAVEVGEEKLGACFGAVEADDAEVLGADKLDAGVEYAVRLSDGRLGTTGGAFGSVTCRHGTCLREGRWDESHSRRWQSGRDILH